MKHNTLNYMNQNALTSTVQNVEEYNKNFQFQRNYHSHYDDDDCDIYYYNPVTREFYIDVWTTRGCCSEPCPQANSEVQKLINQGIIDLAVFTHDLINRFPAWGSMMNMFGVWGTIPSGRYKGHALFLGEYIIPDGLAEERKCMFYSRERGYFESGSWNFECDNNYADAALEDLSIDIDIKIEFLLPWSTLETKRLYYEIYKKNIQALKDEGIDIEELQVAYRAEKAKQQQIKANQKLENSRKFYQDKFEQLIEWSKNKRTDVTTLKGHIEVAKKILVNRYDATMEFCETLVTPTK